MPETECCQQLVSYVGTSLPYYTYYFLVINSLLNYLLFISEAKVDKWEKVVGKQKGTAK